MSNYFDKVFPSKVVDDVIESNINDKNKNSDLKDSVSNLSGALTDAVHQANVSMGKYLKDGTFINPMMKTGYADAMTNSAMFLNDLITFRREEVTAIYHGSWVFRKIVDRVAQDMWSAGIQINNEQDINVLKKVYRRLHLLRSDLIYGTSQSRIYGGAAGLMMVDDGEQDLRKPLNIDGIKPNKVIKLFITDRWYGLSNSGELVSNYKSPDFNTPKEYTFYLDDGQSVTVHHSRVLRFVNRRSPRIIENKLFGWGISELEHIYQDLMNHENTKNLISSLLSKSLLEIVKVKGLRGIMSGLSAGNTAAQSQFNGQFTALNQFRSSNNLVFMDTDDNFEQHTYQFGGLAEILETQKYIIAGAAEMPQVLLYGDTKGGMTSDSPAEMEFYAQTILGRQEQEVRPILDKLLPVLFALEGIKINSIDYGFESVAGMPLDKKLSVLSSTVDTGIKLIENGMMTRESAIEEIKLKSNLTDFGTTIKESDINLAKKMDLEDLENNPEEENIDEDSQEEITDDDNDYEEEKEKVLKKVSKLFDRTVRRKK